MRKLIVANVISVKSSFLLPAIGGGEGATGRMELSKLTRNAIKFEDGG